MISLDKHTGSCNVLLPKICVPKKTKDINVEVFNMITNKNEAKKLVKYISCDCKCKFNSTTCNLNQKGNIETCQCECKKDYSWNSRTCIYEDSKYLESTGDTSVIEVDANISVLYLILYQQK